jgi:hypothetical protein
MWYVYTIEFYSVIKKNEILSFASKWMGRENIILSKVRHRMSIATCILSYMEWRPNTNIAILWKPGHPYGRTHKRRRG